MADVIGTPALRAEFDSRDLLKGAKDAGAKLKTTFEESNRNVEAVQRNASRRIQGLISQINAEKPRRQMFELGQAVQHMGGVAALSEQQVAKLRVQVERLTAAGAKAPKSLAGLTSSTGGGLGAAFTSLTSGGGVSGALAAIGPAGVAAAAGLGAVTYAGGKAFAAIAELADKAEQWSNLAASTGLGSQQVQQLSILLEDAGIPADALAKAMKELQKEIATGGAELKKFGIDVADLKSLSPEEQLRAMAAEIATIPDPAERTAIALAAFGRSGTELIPVMEDVARGADKMFSVLSDEQLASLGRADEALDSFKQKWTFAWRSITATAVEAMQGFRGFAAGGIPIFIPDAAGAAGAAKPNSPVSSGLDRELSLGVETPEQRAAVKAYRDSLKKGDEERKAREEKIAELLAKQAESARKLAFELLKASQLKAPAFARSLDPLETLPQARSLGPGAMVGAKNFDFGIDAQGFVTWGDAAKEAGEKVADAAAESKDWGGSLNTLANQLQTLALSTGGFTGKLAGLFAALSSGAGGIMSGIQGFKDSGKGLMGVLGKISGIGGIVSSAVGLFSGIKSLFGGKSKEQKEAERKAKEDAEKAKREAEKNARVEKQRNLEQGLGTARGGAEALMARLAEGGLSQGLSAALQTIIGKVGDALLKSGLGVLDGRLKDSKEFQGAQGAAGEVATVMQGMRQAGMVDAGLMAATGGAAAEIQAQAIAAAKAAGMTDAEAAKAGSAAISGLLREQLNASIASGKELDENTKQLLKTAEENGISILADPALESLDVQKDQLSVLREIAGQRGGKAPGSVGAAKGLGPLMTKDLGGGLGPLIQTHPGELVWVLPKALAKGGILSAARGIYNDDPERAGGGGGGAGGSGSGDGSGSGGMDVDGGSIPGGAATVEAIVAAVSAAVQRVDRPQVNLQVTQQLTESPFASAESKSEARAFTLDAAADALAANSGRFAQEIDRRINARMAALR